MQLPLFTLPSSLRISLSVSTEMRGDGRFQSAFAGGLERLRLRASGEYSRRHGQPVRRQVGVRRDLVPRGRRLTRSSTRNLSASSEAFIWVVFRRLLLSARSPLHAGFGTEKQPSGLSRLWTPTVCNSTSKLEREA